MYRETRRYLADQRAPSGRGMRGLTAGVSAWLVLLPHFRCVRPFARRSGPCAMPLLLAFPELCWGLYHTRQCPFLRYPLSGGLWPLNSALVCGTGRAGSSLSQGW